MSFDDRAATHSAIADLRTGVIGNDGFGNAETMTGIELLGPGTVFADMFSGDDNRNFLYAGVGDNVYGQGGDDVIIADAAPAMIDGGAGLDELRLLAGGGLRPDANGDGLAEIAPTMTGRWLVFLAAEYVEDGYGNVGEVTGVENVSGSELGDDILGDENANRLAGQGGDDVLFGRGGDDDLSGGDGDDILHGGTGVDRFDGGANDLITNGSTIFGDQLSFGELRATQGAIADLRTGVIANDGFGNVEAMTGIESLGPDGLRRYLLRQQLAQWPDRRDGQPALRVRRG